VSEKELFSAFLLREGTKENKLFEGNNDDDDGDEVVKDEGDEQKEEIDDDDSKEETKLSRSE
jgi:TATA-binding protein-associated factor Taf7